MSFLSAVGHFLTTAGADVVKVTNAVQPYAGLIEQIPNFGGAFGLIFNSVVQVEKLAGEVSGKGADKFAAVRLLVMLAYPKIDPVVLERSINGLVAILNDIQRSLAVPVAPAHLA